MNKVILIGNLTKDPELSTTNSGISVCRFTLAVQRRFTNAEGERETDFLNITVWRGQAENCSKYLRKGSKACVTGSIQTRSYDAQDGTKRYTTDVVVDNFTFIGSGANSAGTSYQNSSDSSNIATTDISEDPFKDFGDEVALSDDDLPF